METKEYILVALSVGQLLIMAIGFYRMFRDPDEKAAQDISNLREGCSLKHGRIDEVISEMRDKFKSIDNNLVMIKENDIKHIEQEMRRISDVQTKILTILEYEGEGKRGIKVVANN